MQNCDLIFFISPVFFLPVVIVLSIVLSLLFPSYSKNFMAVLGKGRQTRWWKHLYSPQFNKWFPGLRKSIIFRLWYISKYNS